MRIDFGRSYIDSHWTVLAERISVQISNSHFGCADDICSRRLCRLNYLFISVRIFSRRYSTCNIIAPASYSVQRVFSRSTKNFEKFNSRSVERLQIVHKWRAKCTNLQQQRRRRRRRQGQHQQQKRRREKEIGENRLDFGTGTYSSMANCSRTNCLALLYPARPGPTYSSLCCYNGINRTMNFAFDMTNFVSVWMVHRMVFYS